MKKTLGIILMSISIFMFVIASPAMAGGIFGGGDEYNNNNSGIIGDKNHHNNTGTINNGANAGGTIKTNIVNYAKGGDGGEGGSVNIGNGMFNKTLSPEANATVGDIKNTNTNLNTNFNTNKVNVDNKNTNFNTNLNTNKNIQGQDQDQKQKQGQAQGQSQSNSNKVVQGQAQANKQILTINEAENKRAHLEGPSLLKSNAKFTRSKALSIKTHGWEILDKITNITWKQAKKLGKDADDFVIEEALLFENSFTSANVINLQGRDPKGQFMGYLYLIPDGDEVNAAGGVGRIAIAAMKAGASHFRVVKIDAEAVFADGRSWNIGLGGGASIMRSGDGVAIAPNGGLGYGKATAYNDKRPAAVAELYFDENAVVKKTSRWSNDENNVY